MYRAPRSILPYKCIEAWSIGTTHTVMSNYYRSLCVVLHRIDRKLYFIIIIHIFKLLNKRSAFDLCIDRKLYFIIIFKYLKMDEDVLICTIGGPIHRQYQYCVESLLSVTLCCTASNWSEIVFYNSYTLYKLYFIIVMHVLEVICPMHVLIQSRIHCYIPLLYCMYLNLDSAAAGPKPALESRKGRSK